MAEKPTRPGDGEDETYMLDLEEEASADADEVAREALAAVSNRQAHEAPPRREKGVETVPGQEPTPDPAVTELQNELADLRDRSIRTLADFENYRRRAERERDDLKRYAVGEALRDLLPVVDNLQRALAAGGTVDDLKVGVELTLRQFTELLRQRGISEVPAMGAPFDPTVHEAVASVEDASVTVPTVIDELQRGYTIHGRLLRPALVRVAMPPEREKTPG
ncbi:MAG TPA: nucleotide exchange factor GrpE [Thermoanaerobaculia bacterium]|jgi:molecular chaperone GrpE|nr:nucleotide exchange factor GrpE [Thermoanaerobaculia bacterium]